jgi:hypothetical protein
MSSQKTSNNDSCRDLSGRRLSTIKEARKCVLCCSLVIYAPRLLIQIGITRLAEYLENEPARLAAKADVQKAKLEALERKLGIDAGPSASGSSSTGGPSSPTSKAVGPGEPAASAGVIAGKKHRFDDTEYLEQSRDIVDGVKSAVSVGVYPMIIFIVSPLKESLALLKKKKAKLSHNPTSASTPTDKQKATEKSVESPVTAPIAVSRAAIGA